MRRLNTRTTASPIRRMQHPRQGMVGGSLEQPDAAINHAQPSRLMIAPGRSCRPLWGVVELDGHGPRGTVADVDSHVKYACNFVVRNLTQKVEKTTCVKRFFIVLHDSPQTTPRSWRVGRAWATGIT